MNYRDVLLGLTTYPEASSSGAVKWAVSLAELLDCRLTAFAADIKVEVPGRLLGNLLIDISALAAAEMNKSRMNASELLAAFTHEAEKRGVPHVEIHEQCLVSAVPDLMADYARMKDLTIMPVPVIDFVDQWYAETVVFQSGRPVLIVSDQSPPAQAKLDTVAVAWDFGRTAARAVADALPLLERAKLVRILCVLNEKSFGSSRGSSELAAHLAHHGVNVVVDEVDAGGRTIGAVMERFTADHQVDLLVMGAYGHSRFREFILGGATKSVMARPPVPTFLSH